MMETPSLKASVSELSLTIPDAQPNVVVFELAFANPAQAEMFRQIVAKQLPEGYIHAQFKQRS